MSDWRDEAACATADPEAFFQLGGGRPSALALRTRRGCAVRVECLAAALAEDARDLEFGPHGVRGGLTPAQRSVLRRAAS